MAAASLRVAMITTFYPPLSFGGDAQYVRRLAHALAARGVEVEIIFDGDAWRVLSGAIAGAALPEPAGVTVHRLQSLWPLGSTLLTHQLGRPVVQARKLREILAKGFDVIHYHNVSLVGGPGIMSFGDALKFYTPHDHWLVCPTHVLWRHNRELCTGRECLKCNFAYRRPPQLWRATRYLEQQSANVDVFIALSRSVAENHSRFGFSREMMLMSPFVGPSTAREPFPRRTAQRPYFLFVGRLEALKGLQELILEFDPALPADLWIAGTGTFEPELRRVAADRPQIRFLGHVPETKLVALYREALAVVAPSLGYEVFPSVVLEAFREGTPVVVRELGPYPQIIEESGGGLLFRDPNELRAALARLAGDGALRARLGASGQRTVETRWSEDTAVAAYLELIRRTAKSRSRPDISAKVDALPGVAKADATRAQ